MPLLNRGAIANFFGLADEEEYEYPDFPETKKQTVTQSQTQKTVKPTVNKPTREATQTVTNTSHYAIREEKPTVGQKKVIELRQAPTRPVKQEEKTARQSYEPKTNLANKITVMEPRAYSEAMMIAKKIIAGEATLVNFHLVEEKQARRIVDFLTGTVYALDGDIKRVGDEMFLCTPTGMEIDSSTAQTFADANIFDL
ncbi:cell division protein SepF [Enterococcus thailandicus]|nr:cell division protein SepF [Enterococcus thailandicus]ASZ07981.1 cell division protein SepF [Enterococcus thailandicus]MDK4351731.1 cell division protein SepF [Enterococcus thailandicus]MDT2734336.1 cell division protein SepF [Enterococcus thailandicus]MEA4830389.1 cell division protein SepF [Enterococcus thailandicus]GMC03177.1 cell division protein SepF [Enterococcus thailandicus]